MNKYSGVVGVYNCQGAAWNSEERKNTFHHTNSDAITGYVRGRDVHHIAEAAVDGAAWDGNVAVYAHTTGALVTLPYNVAMPISLKVLEHEIYTVTPVKVLAPDCAFAPLGLLDMFNGGGALETLEYAAAAVSLGVKGCGRFGAYSSTKPIRCTVGSSAVEFEYEAASGLVTFNLAEMPAEGGVHSVEIEL